MKTCSITGCGKRHYGRGWCRTHYMRWFHWGDANHPPTRIYGLWEKVEKTDTCWLWIGAMNDSGYGVVFNGERMVRAHRHIYELLVGPIPEGLQLDHLCRVRHCVNPDHLEPVTPSINMRRGDTVIARNVAKTECVNGHAYTPANTITTKKGRACRTCHNERRRVHSPAPNSTRTHA